MIRRAERGDLAAIIRLLADDPLGRLREDARDPVPPAYLAAFEAIDRDSNQLLAVVEEDGLIVGCLQLTFIPGLSRQGMWRGQIESVRVARSHRGRGLGRKIFDWAIAACRARRCGLVQLTTDKSRAEAHAFYAALGFTASHEGLKLTL
ncbi:GNAT family N-acetyltransferase [Pararhodobacter sp. SW119]|uniref:GNAT family N-acetyltransferase n=1 Tax=Pararhodobacter sp. SW119 TaxID=2780075 RepID=UPI001AE0B908|nr:GNAT family N-acetyltransferase [Pararhodobacter sp. SW119]